ncbi:acyltransferase family protein [Halopseudomonas bauzanensis]|uniref:Acyltransferase n=1 Tax=Halopseudomonas bauzanensis TaxID=653930 RepID=A0A4U0YM84_9GAMM|nr:acyltransferase family protein [Halopseudomonas bauzanensis]TKA93422.1 acyltransferase [Halopseudomonas bauzanensis]
MENRDLWVDHAKALGIVLVVYGHVLRGLHSAGIPMPETFYQLSDSIVYSFHMPLFFFLAGLFFRQSLAAKGARGMVFSKLDSIFYPYVLWSILQGLIEAALADYTNGAVTYAEVFALLWAPRAQFWFLYALLLCFLLAVAVFSLSRRSILPVVVIAALLYLFPPLLPEVVALRYIADNFVFFALGILYADQVRGMVASGWQVLFMLGLFAAAQYGFHGLLELHYADRGMLSLLLALLSIAAVVTLCSWSARRPLGFVAYLGTASMAIYLMHILAGSGVRVLLKVGGVDSFLLHAVAGVAGGLLLPLLALAIAQRLQLRYLFSAPISRWLTLPVNWNQPRAGR